MEKTWFELTFEEKLHEAHKAVLFSDKMDKNRMDLLSMIVQRLIDKTHGMTNDEIDKFLGYD
jgi:hypothetical protein